MNTKTIFITGATDGIGLETARILAKEGHKLLIHGRNRQKLAKIHDELSKITNIEAFEADFGDLNSVFDMAQVIKAKNQRLDALINNAGVFKTPNPTTKYGIDLRFIVNTYAPLLLTQELLPTLLPNSRVINLSSAAQSTVSMESIAGGTSSLEAMSAYSQSKLAITMWTFALAVRHKNRGVSFIAVNPGSLLASKMVKEGFGIPGKSLAIGANVLFQATLSEKFAVSGQYFDNDSGQFSDPHSDALDSEKCLILTDSLEAKLPELLKS